MKTLTALVTALTLVGFSGAAFACDGMYKQTGDTTAAAKQERVIPKPGETT
jgi:hypothetical protein